MSTARLDHHPDVRFYSIACGRRSSYRLSTRNVLHTGQCRHGWSEPLLLHEIVNFIIDDGKIAQCCGASPMRWIKTQAEAFRLALEVLTEVGST